MSDLEKEKPTIEELAARLSAKEYKFCEEYILTLNGTKSAIAAKYAKNSARITASKMLTKTNIKAYIAARLDDYGVTDSEIVKMMVSVAKSSVNDYIVPKKVDKPVEVLKPLSNRIDEIRLSIRKKEMYMQRASLTEDEVAAMMSSIASYRNEIIKIEIDLEIDPNATYSVWETEEVEIADLDILALARDKENGKIKGFKQTQFGTNIELSDPDGMIVKLAQMKGLITNKVEAEINSNNKNVNMNVTPTDEEAARIANAILKDI